MSPEDDISGAALSAKELLREVRLDVKAIGRNVDILVAQNLDQRLRDMENWKSAAMESAARMASDPMATPVGKSLEEGRKANASRINKLERTIWVANGFVMAVVLAANFLPSIVNLLIHLNVK